MADQLDTDPNMTSAEQLAEKADPNAPASKSKPQIEQSVETATEDIDRKLMKQVTLNSEEPKDKPSTEGEQAKK